MNVRSYCIFVGLGTTSIVKVDLWLVQSRKFLPNAGDVEGSHSVSLANSVVIRMMSNVVSDDAVMAGCDRRAGCPAGPLAMNDDEVLIW